MAFGSKVLSEIEKRYSACERKVLALTWALQRWVYLTGMSPIVLKTVHTPIKYVLSGKANEGRVSNPLLADWTLNLVNRDIQVNKVPTLSAAPLALITQGKEQECPLPTTDIKEEPSPFQLKTSYEEAKSDNMDL